MSRAKTPWLVAGLAVLVVFAAGGLGWAALRPPRTSAPDADAAAELALEAELQEIIAEHRAGELARRETSGVTGPPG